MSTDAFGKTFQFTNLNDEESQFSKGVS